MNFASTMRGSIVAVALSAVTLAAQAAGVVTVATSAGVLSVNAGSSGTSPAPINAIYVQQSGSFPSANLVPFTASGASGTITLQPADVSSGTSFKSGIYVNNTPGSHVTVSTSAQATIPVKTLVLNKTKIAFDVSAQLSLSTTSANNRFSDFPVTATLTATDKSGNKVTVGTAQLVVPGNVTGQAVSVVGRTPAGFVPTQFSLNLGASAPTADAASGTSWPATLVYSSAFALQRLTLRPIVSSAP